MMSLMNNTSKISLFSIWTFLEHENVFFMDQLIVAQWWHLISDILVNTGVGNGLVPVQCQPISTPNGDIISSDPLGTKFSDILIKIFIL